MPVPYNSDDTVTLFLGDCREILPLLDVRADLIVTDPPYEETSLQWDRWPAGWLDVAAGVADSMWCFLPLRQFAMPPYRGHEFAAAGWKLSQDLVPDAEEDHDHLTWEKHNGSSFARDRFKRVHEPVSHWYLGAWSGVHHDTPPSPVWLARRRRSAATDRPRTPARSAPPATSTAPPG